MTLTIYLSFKGDCEAAFKFYEQKLGGQLGQLFRYGGSPMEATAPPGWHEKIMHGSITIGGQVLMGADVGPDTYEAPKGFSLSLNPRTAAEADRVFEALAEDGQELMPLEKTFWSERFGMIRDRFGLSWMINCEGSGESA
jgi:PhnB protein